MFLFETVQSTSIYLIVGKYLRSKCLSAVGHELQPLVLMACTQWVLLDSEPGAGPHGLSSGLGTHRLIHGVIAATLQIRIPCDLHR